MLSTRPRRLLLVSYHFGPGCATGGFRWNATTRELAERGWEVDVLTVARSGLRDGPIAGTDGRVRIIAVEPFTVPKRLKDGLLGALRRVRSLLRGRSAEAQGPPLARDVDPDELFVWRTGYRRSLRERLSNSLDYVEQAASELVWARRVVRRARTLLAASDYRAIVVSSPPHLTHVVGARLTRAFDVPYVADYRDPWTLGLGRHVGYVGDLERWLGGHLERRTLRTAHTVVHNTEWARRAVADELRFPGAHVAIRNGYDDVSGVGTPDPDCFRIVYTGHLYPFMDVRPLFAATARLLDRHALRSKDLRIDFVGTPSVFEGVALSDLARAYGLEEVFHWHPRLPRDEAAAFQEKAAVLAAYDWLFPVAVVSKFYEYSRMRGAPLLIGNTEGALADAAAEIGLRVIDADDETGIDAFFEAAYERWRRNDFARVNDPDGIFDRRRQSQRICELLEQI